MVGLEGGTLFLQPYLEKIIVLSLIQWINLDSKKHHPIEFAALVHHRFVAIHPFEDGNGRTGRLLMNLLLMREAFPIAIILKADRIKYYRALERADQGELQMIAKMVAQAVERTLNIYSQISQVATPKNQLLRLSELSQKSEFSPKHLNFLARGGLLEARKDGRVWLSSLDALEVYRKSRLRKR